jgi:Plavaka transposase
LRGSRPILVHLRSLRFLTEAVTKDAKTSKADIKRIVISRIIRDIFESFKEAAAHGINLVCPDGKRRLCHPILCEYIADYPEQTLLSSVLSGVCPRCTIPKYSAETIVNEPNSPTTAEAPNSPTTAEAPTEPKSAKRKREAQTESKPAKRKGPKQPPKKKTQREITVLTKRRTKSDSGDTFKTHPLRTAAENRALRARYQADPDGLKSYGLKPDPPFTDGFDYSNIHEMIAPDILHQVSKMLYDDLFEWIQKYLILKHPRVPLATIIRELDARFSHLPPYPGLKHFGRGISATERWTGNEYKAMARVLLPVISDLLPDKEMVALVRSYLDIVMLSHYTSHTEATVEYLQNAVNEYTKLRSGPNSLLVELGILPAAWYSPKQHWLQHYAEWIPNKGPLPFCSTDRSEGLHKMHKADYKKSNKTHHSDEFVLNNESRALAMTWFESTLSPEQRCIPPEQQRKLHSDLERRIPDSYCEDDDEDYDEDDEDDEEYEDDEDDGEDTPTGDLAGTKIRLGGCRWKNSMDVQAVEEKFNLPHLTTETKKRLRWFRRKQDGRFKLIDYEEAEIVQIAGYTVAKLQYPSVQDTATIKTETIRSVDQHQYHKNRDRTGRRFDAVLIRWDGEDGSHTMSNQRIGRVHLLFSTFCNVTKTKIKMAYVECLKVPTNSWDPKTEMFSVTRVVH